MNPGPARVLEALRRAGGRTCSGEALSNEQGVSRTQVWKYVEALRRSGYTVDAAPGGGYRLAGVPDRLYPEEIRAGLGTRWLGREIRYFESTGSTNRDALAWAREGAPHGAAVVADGQTAGRGRLGRSFFSPPFENLYTSIVLRPSITTALAPAWPLAAAVGVAETVGAWVDDPDAVEIKWPNDVLIGGRKTCGILMELSAEAARVSWMVVGIGVNLNVDPARFPEEFQARATSLRCHRRDRVDRVRFTRDLYGSLEQSFDLCAEGGFAAVRPRFAARFHMEGRRVRVVDHDGAEDGGVVRGVDADGALRVAREDGEEVRVLAGDVTLAKEAP